MTERYLGSIITANPVEPSANTENSAASGVWNIHDPLIFGQASDWPDPTVASPNKFVENLFSCFAYTGNGGSQTITNGIDLSNEGGLVWLKCRNAGEDHMFFDTARGATNYLQIGNSQQYSGFSQAFTSSGFSFNTDDAHINDSSNTYMSWTFRKQPKFFDVVTYTGTGSALTVDHNLGSVPGMIWIKRSDGTADWRIFHRSVGATKGLRLNGNDVPATSSNYFNDTAPTSTQFTVGTDLSTSGGTFVAYLFAHNDGDGGFGSTGDQDIIKCGIYDGDGSSSNSISLGFEPQFLIIKNITETWSWLLFDSIRGITHYGADDEKYFVLENNSAEAASGNFMALSADGFKLTVNNANTNNSGKQYIYMAIRRGPMQTPTAATSVFDVQKYTGNATNSRKITTNFVVDANITSGLTVDYRTCWGARLFDGIHQVSQTTEQYYALSAWMGYDHNDGYIMGESTYYGYQNSSGIEYISYSFSRAPKFFDVVTYAGTGSATTVKHNLEVTPELMIIKNIAATAEWIVYSRNDATDHLHLNAGDATADEDRFFNDTAPTSSVFTVGDRAEVNASSNYYVAYLFATLAGISKVGTYSGTGSDVNVDCGFTSGARFVLVKRTDSSGDWYHWDSVNGIVDGNDPYLLLNSDAAQVTNTDYIDPLSSGFTITSNAGSDLNASGGTYLFLAIA
jgi:hypothetical protein